MLNFKNLSDDKEDDEGVTKERKGYVFLELR